MKNNTVNIMKGLCMILVVLGHANCPFKSFIYLFHVSVFFMISGFLFKDEYYQDPQSLQLLFRKRLSSLWLPYVLSNLFFLVLTISIFSVTSLNILVKVFCIKVLKIVFFCFEPALGGSSWFLGTLFFVTMLFAHTNYFFKQFYAKYQIPLQALLSIGFICFTCIYQSKNWDIKIVFARILTVYILFFLGYINKHYNISNNSHRVHFLGFIGLGILLLSHGIEVDIASNIYPNFFLLIVLSLAGWFFIFSIALFIEKSSIIAYLLEYIGSHTMSILLFHFTIFKIFDLLKPQNFWWQKTILSIILPLLIQIVFKQVVMFFNKYSKISIIS